MPDHYCFVCASNEGVFLDVTPDNRSTFGDQIRTCLSTKINESIDLSNKICYKCAYELDQCTKFVQRYRNSHKVPEPKIETSMRCCFLCYELVESNRIFDISKDKSVFNPLRKIRSIFNDDINKKNNSWLICLTCRYNLDVLYDLKRIYQDSFNNLKALINEEINYSNYPKIHTDVVNRKTTITTFPDITFYGSINSDSDSNEDMARGKRHIKGRKARSNIQMKPRNNKSKVRSCDKCHNTVANDIDMYRFYHTGLTVCKNCWITMDPSIAKSQRRSRQNQFKTETKLCAVFLKDVLSQSLKKEKDKAHEKEKDKDDNASFVNSQEEAKYSEESSSLSISPKMRNHIVNEQQSNAHLTKTRGRKRIMDNRSSDSEDSQKQKETDKIKLNESVNNTKKKQKIKGTTSSARSDSSDEISIEEDKSLKNRLKATSSSTAPTKKEQESNIRSRTRSSSMSSTEMTSTEFKSPKSLSQSEVKTEYTCDKCNKKFDSKLASAKHKLTHLKQAALKLEKITVANIKVKQETDLISQDEISEETMSRSDRTSVDKCTDDSEDAIVNIEDNTNDEPCSLGDTKNAKEKMEEKKSVESDTDEKPDIAMNESRLEESINDEKTKSEKCENSVIPDNRVIEDDEGKSNKNVKDEYTTKKEDKTSDRDNDKFEDNDAQEATIVILEDHKNMENENEEEDKNVEIKNDTEVSSTEKENIINECNKDNEEVTSDNEMTSLSILSNNRTKDNKDQDENFENNLENNFIDDDREIIEKPEIQSDLIDESSKIHIEESEENLPEILPIDETETLNEKNDLDDIIAIDEEIEQLQQQQKSNEENTEVEIIADIDEPNNKHRKLEEELKELEELVVESNAMNNKYEVQEDSTYVPDNSSADAATEILKEVFDLAAAEVQQREEIITKTLVEDVGMEMETLENISREIRKSADMPSLDPISVMDIDDDGIMLN
ncbi:hypothetical protein ALC53_00407 [Atta colombica]|uniref:Uncharacterized protein n=1 Tax=Atta colombica TaxID=520822 RepID=A0A195BW59_9HYME|nr:hypothetical protein ALC53_00407 [Atta colombica]